MKQSLVVSPPENLDRVYGPEELELIASRTRLLHPPLTWPDLRKQPGLLAEADCLFSTWGVPPLEEDLLALAPRLEAFFYAAGTVKMFTTGAFWDRGIVLCSAWAMNAIPVAEYTFAQIILSLKRAWQFMDHGRRTGEHAFGLRGTLRIPGAYGSTVGLISCGQIGRLVAERLRTLDVRVLVYDPFLSPSMAEEMGVEPVSLEELFSRSDVVSCHTPWLKETEGMLHRDHFASMKDGATFINTARGAVVNEGDLAAVLGERPDLYALLDVTWPEPPAKDHPFHTLPNVILTPHIAGSMSNECRRMAREMIAEFERWEAGTTLRWQVTREMAEKMA